MMSTDHSELDDIFSYDSFVAVGPPVRQLPEGAGADISDDWRDLYADERSARLHAEGRELARRDASAAEATGRRTLVRAAFTCVVGGGIITLVSMAFGPRFFTNDVRALGILVGLAIVALGAVAPIGTESRKTGLGALIIVAAILAFPIAAGGYFIGSIISVIGGSLLVAYEPPPSDVEVTVRRAGRVRRATGLVVDFVAAFVAHRLLFALAPDFFTSSVNVVVAWAFAWLAVAVVPTMWTRRTPGRVLVVLRLVDVVDAARAPFGRALLREALRGVVAIGGFLVLARALLGDQLAVGRFALAALVLAVIGLALERLHVLDRLTGTVSVYDEIETQ